MSAPHCATNFIFFSGQNVAQDLAGSSLRHYNWQSCSQTRSTKFGHKNEFDLKSVGCALEYGLLVTLQNMFDVSPIRCFWCIRIIEFCIYKSLIVVSQNPWFVYLQIIDFCTYKSMILVPTNHWDLYLQIHDSCTYNSSKFVPPFEDPLTYEVRLKGLKFVPRFPRILYPGFCKICTSKSWFFVPTYHRFLYLQIIDLCTPKSVICVPRNHWSLCFQIIDLCTTWYEARKPLAIRSGCVCNGCQGNTNALPTKLNVPFCWTSCQSLN